MRDKILFWLGVEFTHFCLSNAMQEKFDADYYALVDITAKTKKFFKQQNMVDFKNTWFFFDYVKKQTKKPDFEYLAKFEEKYKINLWTLAINERIFYRFYDFYKFSNDEIYSILEQECKLFEKILDEVKPNFIVTKDPSRHHHQLFVDLCNAKNIDVLLLSRTTLGNKVILSKNSHHFDTSIISDNYGTPKRNFEQLRDYLNNSIFSKYSNKSYTPTNQNNKIFALRDYLLSDTKENEEQYYYYGRNKINVLINAVSTRLKTKQRKKFLNNNSLKNPNLHSPFVYFPLHVDMERPLLIGAPFYTNQIEIIRHIVKSLPVNYRLLVKESPAGHTRSWRPKDEYKSILEIPNVYLINPKVPAEDLYKNCSLVFTVAGTSGFEAAFFEKPTIVFSDVGYLSLPSIFRVKNIEELPQIIRKALDTKIKSEDVNKFLNFMIHETIDFEWWAFQKDFYEKFYYDGNLHDVEISESKLKQFVNLHQNELDLLANEHIQKIQSYKQIN